MKKIYALYLPQYHQIPENDEWWGKGYTEWNAVKAAKPLFKGHVQPRIPLNDNYYDLSDESGCVWQWQADLANKYGVNGFCIYHYWFENGKQLLEKPMEILLNHPEISIDYFVCWANEPWRKTWYSNNCEILVDQKYGDKSHWEEHFKYLEPFFLDKRYVKIDNRPVVAIYKTASIKQLNQMRALWDEMAQQLGFDGIYILGAKTSFEQETRLGIVDGEYLFEPAYTMHYQSCLSVKFVRVISRLYRKVWAIIFKKKVLEQVEDISVIFKSIHLPKSSAAKKVYYGICPSWDNTPRKQHKGCVFKNATPAKFGKRLRQMIYSIEDGDFIMINAWNEWGEGAYLEPDKLNGYEYLEEIRRARNKQ